MKKYLFIGLLSTIFVGCSNDDNSNSSSANLVQTMSIDAVNPAEDDYNLTFSYNGNKLINVKDSGVTIEVYTYTNGNLTKINYPEDDSYIEIVYNSANQVIKFTEIYPDDDEAVKTLVTYNDMGFIKTIYSGNLVSQELLERTENYSVANGNVTQISSTGGGFTTVSNFNYDDKNNPFKNISNYSVFQILDLDIDGNSNNVLGDNFPGNPETVTYDYNSENYPTTENTFSSGGTLQEVTTYTYN